MKREILFTVIFSFFILLSNQGFSQTSISGIINLYAAVDSIYPTKDTIEVTNASAFFSDNDTVMVYQAKGAEPKTTIVPQPYNFGSVRNFGELTEAGKYEIILIQRIDGNKIIFKATLNNDYDTDDLVQLIRVPSYKSASIDAELTCETWNGSVGGVLALMVSDTLYLNANINVEGKGFRGAIPFYYDNLTFGNNCASEDSALYGSQYFNESSDNVSAGYKGEGVAKTNSIYRKGLGRWANGGGGGNARFSGGGGGGNDGNGGYGGEEDTTTCSTPAYETNPDYFFNDESQWNALGGSDGFGLGKQNFVNDSTIFMGGGGGSGTYISGLTASSGGNGGGIVIIIAKIIKSSGNSIIANGSTVTDIADASGAGGGAGGTIVFDVDSVIGNLNVLTKGSDGGRVLINGKSGPGGGGGGGPVLWNSSRPGNVTLESAGGAPGYAQDLWPDLYYHKAKSGSGGTEKINVKVPLTGFLFNSITSDQQICMNDVPDLISGSEPRGGTGTFTFEWQYKAELTGWAWTPTGVTSRDFQPPALTDTTYYKRIVTSGSIEDHGNEVQIIVHDYVVANNIFMADDSIICIGNEADTITGTEVILGGNNEYQYIWEYSFNSTSWVTETETEDTIYMHGTIADTTYVRRVVISGACEDTAWLLNPIIGLPPISNNVLSPDQEICEGQIPDEIIGGEPGDGFGLGTYFYSWDKSSDNIVWNIIPGALSKDYQPPVLYDTKYYRRTVQSDDCFDVSDSIKINVLIPISNNFIDTTLLIYTCYNTPPPRINGSTPENGDGTYLYQWQESSDAISWSNISSNANYEDYQPIGLVTTKYFRRLVSSGVNACCTSITDTIEVDINLLPEVTIADIIDTICSNEEITLDFEFNSGQPPYTLTYNDGETDFTSAPIDASVYNPIVSPETILESKVYDYTIVSVVDDSSCVATEITGLTKITVYGFPISNAGLDDEVCQLSYQLSAIPSPFGSGMWSEIPGDGETTFEPNTLANTNLTVTLAGKYSYIWKEINWQCEDSDTVVITMYENFLNVDVIKPIEKGDIDTTLRFIEEIDFIGYYENPDTFKTVIEKRWEVFNGDPGITISPSDTVKNVTFGSLNDAGNEYIEIQWHVDKGACADTIVIRRIKLEEIFEPTGFTPNGDGVNDYALFSGLENSDEHEVIIFNRWGTEVYSAKNFSNEVGWDGKNKDGKDLPEDTYYYVLTFTKGTSTQTSKGFIVLKRF